MMTIGSLLQPFAAIAQAAAPLAVTALWQGTIVAAALTICLRLAPRVTASQRFLAWSAGFAVVAALPFLPLLARGAADSPATGYKPASARPFFAIGDRWAWVIAALWLAMAAYRFVRLVAHIVHLRSLWRSARPVPKCALADLSTSPGTDEICATQSLDRPSVIGFFRPRILIPEWLFDKLSPSELEQVILHEREHLRRRDDWTNLLQKLCLVVFPLNPALVWIDARLSHEREMACDEGVVRRTRAPRAYAACLASLAERGLERRAQRQVAALSLAAWRRRSELADRVHSILRRRQSLHPAVATAVLAAVAAGLAGTSIELARCPQLVAFVAPQPQTIAALSAEPVSAQLLRAASPASSGYRAVAARAILPGNPNVPAVLGDAPLLKSAHRAASVSANRPAPTDSIASRAQNVALRQPQTTFSGSESTAEQIVVFTAFEQIVPAPHRRQRMISDYDRPEAPAANMPASEAPATAAPSSEAAQPDASQPAPPSVQQFAVTRLILKIDPAANAAAAKTSPAIAPVPGQPIAVPFGNGWLVFQL